MIRVVQRALKVLECFDLEHPRLSLHDISLRIVLPKSTTFRILSTLVAEGYLVQPDKQEYALSHKVMRLAAVAQHALGLRDIVHPVLQRLAAATGETAEVSMLDGDGRICLDVVESSSSLKSIVSVGTRLPLLFGATGKMFLAHLDPAAIERALAARPDAGVDRAELDRQLTAIRSDGYALTRDERVRGATAIAVPVSDGGDRVSYCLTVTGPSGRFAGREEHVRTAALAAAAEVSMLLGAQVRAKPAPARAPAGADPAPRALQHLRVLDLTQDLGYASKLFSDLGATVILVEPPDGIAARHRGPFLGDRPGPDRSLRFQYLSAGKCSVVVDFTRAEDRSFFARLLDDADLVIDDQLQDVWVQRGFDFAHLTMRHPQLVWCAVTPFGQHGPRAREHADDFTLAAAGGMAWLTGYADSGPMVASGALASYSAAQYAAVTSMIALFGRARTGGQFVDVSMQEVVALGTETAPQFYDLKRMTRRRLGDDERQAGIGTYPCRDGFVLLYAADSGLGTGWSDLVEWITASLPEASSLRDPTWRDNAYKATAEAKIVFRDLFARFASGRGKQELFEEGQRRNIAIAPINEADEAYADPHLAACGSFTTVARIDGEAVIGPGAPYRLGATPWRAGRRAPRLGEHMERLRRRFRLAAI